MRGGGIAIAGVLILGGILSTRTAGPEPPSPAVPDRPRAASDAVAPVPLPAPPPPRAAEPALAAVFRGDVPSELPSDILSAPATVESPPGDAALPLELGLTDSQNTIVGALLAERDGVLAGLRARIAASLPTKPEADLLCARAEKAHADFVAGVRGTLLPDQRERFEALLRSGRWGGYVLVIPTRR